MHEPAALDGFAEQVKRDGICVIRGLFQPEKIAEWHRAFLSLFQDRAMSPGGLAPREKERYYLTLPWTAPFADPDMFANPIILGVIDRIFRQSYSMVQLAADTPLIGSEYQKIHRDHSPLFSDDFPTPLYALAVNFPLVDVTEERGPLEMVRGTHRMPREEALRRIESGELPMESFTMSPGDVSIRTPLALHRGTPNRTHVPRPMVVMGYVMSWLHTSNVGLSVPRATYDSFSEEQKRLLRAEIVDKLHFKSETYVEFKY